MTDAPAGPPPRRRVVIADDEALARERLRQLLARHPGWDVVAECRDGPAAVRAIRTARPDLVLLDVRMPGLDGLAVAEALAAAGGPQVGGPAVVFVTAYDRFALPAFDVSAVDYLLKPVDRERFARALVRVEARIAPGSAPELTAGAPDTPDVPHEPPPDGAGRGPASAPAPARRFLVRTTRGLDVVPAADVDWVGAEGNYAALHAGGRVHLVRETMKALEARLDRRTFVRVHRSAIVNVERVRRAEPLGRGEYRLHLADGTRLDTSRPYHARLRAALRG